jgi:putative transposase
MPFFTSPKQGVSGDNFPENFHPGKQFTVFFVVPKTGIFGRKSWESWLQRAALKWGGVPYQHMALLTARALKPPAPLKNVALMGEKKVKGRKRHIVTDTQGHLLHIKVHAANIHDTTAGRSVCKESLDKYPSLRGFSADAGYRKTTENFVTDVLKKTIEISERIKNEWAVLPTRWVVERTLSWLNPFRRLTKDFEISIASAEVFVMIAHSMVLIQRLVE